jgi:hypothetical protein
LVDVLVVQLCSGRGAGVVAAVVGDWGRPFVISLVAGAAASTPGTIVTDAEEGGAALDPAAACRRKGRARGRVGSPGLLLLLLGRVVVGHGRGLGVLWFGVRGRDEREGWLR